MKKFTERTFSVLVSFILFVLTVFGQNIEPRNRVVVKTHPKVDQTAAKVFQYTYFVESSIESKQDVWNFMIIFLFARDSVLRLYSVPSWWGPDIPIEGPPFWLSWTGPKGTKIKPGESLGGFGFETRLPPGITDYYAEGYAPPPSFPEGMAPDSIPGYDDLTPYGPGIIGKTIGPVLPASPFIHVSLLDTLLSYTLQSAELGWLGRDRDNDCDNDERPEDGIVRNIEQRLKKAKRELERRDSVLARRELEKLVGKIERLWKRNQEDDKKDKRDKVVMTSEAYALLKYNTEYLIDRLPDRKPKKVSKDKD